jgi:NAD dependent epimerase/dehydratase
MKKHRKIIKPILNNGITMETVLITGADGFIGSHLTEQLIREGYRVRAFVFYNSFNNWGWLDSLPRNVLESIEVISGDIRDPYGVRSAMKGVDIVFHLAALIAIPFSYHSPEAYVDTNVKGTLNILQAARDLGVSKILVTSTSEVYGTALYVPIDENHPRQAQSPYSATKISADALAESFYRSFDLPVITVRPFNTYGPRQSARAVIPTIVSQLLNGIKEIKLGALSPTRDLVFVKDTVKGFLAISKSNKLLGQQVNIATSSEISIRDLANKIISKINPDAKIVSDVERLRPDNSEVNRLFGSNEKILNTTSWKQEYSLDQGLKETIDWFRKGDNLDRYKSNIYNI